MKRPAIHLLSAAAAAYKAAAATAVWAKATYMRCRYVAELVSEIALRGLVIAIHGLAIAVRSSAIAVHGSAVAVRSSAVAVHSSAVAVRSSAIAVHGSAIAICSSAVAAHLTTAVPHCGQFPRPRSPCCSKNVMM